MIQGGKNLVYRPPAFSGDGKRLLVCTGNTVSIYGTSTGLLITELVGHTATVTSVIVLPVAAPASKIASYCWTSSLDGTIRYWDFSSSQLIKTLEVNHSIYSMVIPNISGPPADDNGEKGDLYALISADSSKSSAQQRGLSGQILVYNLTKSVLLKNTVSETLKPETLVGSYSGEFVGIVTARRLLIWKPPRKNTDWVNLGKFRVRLHHTKSFTTLAFHPSERIVAGGDITGRILIWRGFGKRRFAKQSLTSRRDVENEEERPGVRGNDDAESCATWHWHSTEVKFLSFSSDGTYLYSGGGEGVLVAWQLDTGKKTFLPRFGSALRYFVDSPDPSLSSISSADNQIHLVNLQAMKVLKSIPGIKLPFAIPEIYEGLWSNGFAVVSSAGLVALRTENYGVQFYSLLHDREITQVVVCNRNYQTNDDVTVVVSLLALSGDGSEMSTVEVRLPEEGIGGLVCLKFWECGSHSGDFALSTVIYDPHGDAGISAVAFHPTRSMVVSSSYGGNFKIWIRSMDIQKKDGSLQKGGWRCQSIGTYKKNPMTAAAFSADGSVLAVAAGFVITLWNPNTNTLVAVMGETPEPIVALSFIPNAEHLLSVSRGSNPQLSVWNLSKLSLSWAYDLCAEAMACDMNSSKFAVLVLAPAKVLSGVSSHRDGLILLFEAEDAVPIATWCVKKAKGGGLAFLQEDHFTKTENTTNGKIDGKSSTRLVYLNGDHEYIVFNPFNSGDDTTSKPHDWYHPLENEEPFGYKAMYGKLPDSTDKRENLETVAFELTDKPWETLFSGSSHVLPPLSKLCHVFLASLLEKKKEVTT
ncbi:hypothetical protein AMTRI_Chr02g253980 [Amborella trichopoda]